MLILRLVPILILGKSKKLEKSRTSTVTLKSGFYSKVTYLLTHPRKWAKVMGRNLIKLLDLSHKFLKSFNRLFCSLVQDNFIERFIWIFSFLECHPAASQAILWLSPKSFKHQGNEPMLADKVLSSDHKESHNYGIILSTALISWKFKCFPHCGFAKVWSLIWVSLFFNF